MGVGGDWNQLRGKPILPFLKVTLFSFLFLLSHSLVVVVFFSSFPWTEGMQSQKHRNELPLCTFCSAGGYRYG